MAKRGPKPKTSFPGPSVVFSSRMAPELKAELEKAAAARGRTISDEIQMRLRRTFIEDEKVAEAFGDRETYVLMKTVALAIQWIPASFGSTVDGNWLQDPERFDEAIKMINRLLKRARPSQVAKGQMRIGGRVGVSEETLRELSDFNAEQIASLLWLDIQQADSAMPLNKGTRYEHRLGVLKDEIGHIASRSTETLDDVKRRAEVFTAKHKKAKK